ncbi:hypothetical protein HETIRDRAFT_451038 [Heterobasidion irregulare TC 32-1]|uniref:t-SNARE coiled-coil homology domain-containing protein n=1 Tax=Heterobasidion irregulare (strain TC 32-1) TaxID=747525 RepID=W4KCJ8_HETIT|nr:uncharacterized protein HETIRDRAFT_451038 [Heterobasidion irregulare TC 32-1]ETW83464.1 hypothetical protein HETIRDRAFT_451038 [Heterobasidion irregulare TC 32-1]
MSTSRAQQEDTLEAQNDQRLDDLHSKIRTLRAVTTDIHDDVERQNLFLDDTRDTFTSFGSSLSASASRMSHAVSPRAATALSVAAYLLGFLLGAWFVGRIISWWSA